MNKPTNPQKKFLTIGTYAVLIVLIITFIGAPIISLNTARFGGLVFGRYAGREISYKPGNYFGLSVQNTLELYKSQLGGNALNPVIEQLAWKSAFDQTVLQFALIDAAKTAGFRPSQENIQQSILALPSLQTGGSFDFGLYSNMSGGEKDALKEVQTQVQTATPVYEDLTALTAMSRAEKDFFNAMNSERRAFEYVRFAKNEITDNTLVSDYAEKNKEKFVKISFKSITVGSKKEIESIISDIQNKTVSFAEAAQAYSTDSGKEQDGSRGSLFAYQVSQQEGDAALTALLALSVGSLSEPVQTLQGSYAAYELEAPSVQPNFSQDEFLTAAKNYMLAQAPGLIEDRQVEQAQAFANRAAQIGIAAAAKAAGLEVGSTNAFPVNINNVELLESAQTASGPDIGQLASRQDVLADLFALPVGSFSKPYVIDTYVYVFRAARTQILSEDSINETQFASFMQNARNSMLEKSVVDEKKLKDNFAVAFQKAFPPASQQTPQQPQAQ